MDKAESLGENSIAWINDGFTQSTTNLPDISEDSPIGTLVIIIVSAVASILLLFVMAVFIDCRHQKLSKEKPKKLFRVPRFNRTPVHEDKQSIVNKMQSPEATASPSVETV